MGTRMGAEVPGREILTMSFDTEIDRSGTGALKWEIRMGRDDPGQWVRTDSYFGENRTLPMWVADMDLSCPEPVVAALKERAAHPIYGYTIADESYLQSVVRWMGRRHGWEIESDWILNTHGVVPALHMAVCAFTSPGDKVVVQRPVYYPFFSAVTENGRGLISNSLVLEDGRYRMDFDALEKQTADPRVKLAILCNPQNPVGRVWSPEELETFGRICLKNGVIIVSDEIHGDLIYSGNTFTPIATISKELAGNSVVCTAPSKTFNLAGLQTSNIIIKNRDIRDSFKGAMAANGVFGLNPFGMVACRAAYDHGEVWLGSLLTHLEGNRDALRALFAEELPHVPVISTEGSYLVWFDCRALNVGHLELRDLMVEKARVTLDEGYAFGPEGRGFERINIACPRHVLMEAGRRIVAALR